VETAPAPAIRQGGELEQIQFGRMSVQATERYLGRKQRIHNAVTGRTGLEQSTSAVLNSLKLQVPGKL